jgi:hypothetical protein
MDRTSIGDMNPMSIVRSGRSVDQTRAVTVKALTSLEAVSELMQRERR